MNVMLKDPPAVTHANYSALERQYGARNYAPFNVVLTRGLGVWVWDVDGRRYLDCLSAYSAVNQGHCHPRILAALTEQASRLAITSRAFMNRLVAIDNYKRTDDPSTISPMVISGTHALDIVMWYLEGKQPVECYARSIDKVLGPLYQGIDATAGMIMCADGTVYHLNISWALPVTWPGAVYSLEVGINGTHGVLTIDDTHRDMVLAVSKPQGEGYAPDQSRLVDFLGSYPPGDMALGELRGPMREETDSWLNRVSLGLPTQAATAAEAHNRLMLTKALDLSAKLKQAVKLPLEPEQGLAAA